MNNQHTMNGVFVAIAIVLVGILTYIALSQGIKNWAIDGCANLATSIKRGDYIQPVYKNCLKDKGYTIGE